ncbi:PulJ/GspJ family protein [Alkalicoccus halolimnae]|uniref:Prepilin-type N-terminal cleavage/methylation domain-containing protein n=1 Tax=Alkalicoccus halolimnae TaxID=1667239 RepID=A0A5C7FGZ4_9BACI|nr:prepilin-type N-terminal cleavage/methylation domain-containing protein [Alkalicoccus halolimnae]TXF86577.1 prepilin-type N-terminal cleavage/methylation domain-containing protein [Alkalicoccus halolimnae]
MTILSNQRGVTLLELLAAMVLLSFVGAAAYMFIFNSFTFQERSEERVRLVQEGIVLSAELRSLHENESAFFYSQDRRLYEGNSADGRLITHPDITLSGLSVNSEMVTPGNSVTFTEESSHITSMLINGSYEHEMETTLQTLGDFSEEFVMAAGNNGNDNPPPPQEEDLSYPGEDEIRSISEVVYSRQTNNCTSSGNAVYGQNDVNSWEVCTRNIHSDGNLYFNNPSTFHGDSPFSLEVDGGVMFRNNLIMYNAPLLTASEYIWIGNNLHMFTNGRIETQGPLIVNENLTLENNAAVETNNLIVEGYTRMLLDSRLTVQNDAEFNNGLSTENAPSIQIGNNLTVNGDTILRQSPQLQVAGNAYFNGNLDFQRGSQFYIQGDAVINGNVASNIRWDAGKLCVEGSLEVTGSIPNPVIVRNDVSSCSNQPEGTIYVLNQ